MLHANGSKWIAFCDSDDLWHTDKLQKQLQVLRDNENIDLIGCAFDDKPLRIGLKRINRLYRGTVKDICIKNFPQPSTVIMKKKIYDEIGGFDEKQKYAEDGNYFLKIAANYNLYYLPEQLIDFGFGKRGFGETGLSSNLKEMYAGNVKNLNEIRDAGYINTLFYMMMRIFFGLKYCRRIFITKVCGKKYEYKS